VCLRLNGPWAELLDLPSFVFGFPSNLPPVSGLLISSTTSFWSRKYAHAFPSSPHLMIPPFFSALDTSLWGGCFFFFFVLFFFVVFFVFFLFWSVFCFCGVGGCGLFFFFFFFYLFCVVVWVCGLFFGFWFLFFFFFFFLFVVGGCWAWVVLLDLFRFWSDIPTPHFMVWQNIFPPAFFFSSLFYHFLPSDLNVFAPRKFFLR